MCVILLQSSQWGEGNFPAPCRLNNRELTVFLLQISPKPPVVAGSCLKLLQPSAISGSSNISVCVPVWWWNTAVTLLDTVHNIWIHSRIYSITYVLLFKALIDFTFNYHFLYGCKYKQLTLEKNWIVFNFSKIPWVTQCQSDKIFMKFHFQPHFMFSLRNFPSTYEEKKPKQPKTNQKKIKNPSFTSTAQIFHSWDHHLSLPLFFNHANYSLDKISAKCLWKL